MTQLANYDTGSLSDSQPQSFLLKRHLNARNKSLTVLDYRLSEHKSGGSSDSSVEERQRRPATTFSVTQESDSSFTHHQAKRKQFKLYSRDVRSAAADLGPPYYGRPLHVPPSPSFSDIISQFRSKARPGSSVSDLSDKAVGYKSGGTLKAIKTTVSTSTPQDSVPSTVTGRGRAVSSAGLYSNTAYSKPSFGESHEYYGFALYLSSTVLLSKVNSNLRLHSLTILQYFPEM